jgi:hypothetical protein
VAPDELARVPPRLGRDLLEGRVDPRRDRGTVERIERIARHHAHVAARRLRVEAGRPVGAAEGASREIVLAEGEHAPVLLEGASPRDDVGERERHRTASRSV